MHDDGNGWRARLLKWLRRRSLFVIACTALISIAVVLFERQLMYWPSRVSAGPAEAGLGGVIGRKSWRRPTASG